MTDVLIVGEDAKEGGGVGWEDGAEVEGQGAGVEGYGVVGEVGGVGVGGEGAAGGCHGGSSRLRCFRRGGCDGCK